MDAVEAALAAIGEWARETPAELLTELGARRGARPSESAIRRPFTRVDADILDSVIGAFCWSRTQLVAG